MEYNMGPSKQHEWTQILDGMAIEVSCAEYLGLDDMFII